MIKLALAFVFLSPSFAFAVDQYKCVSKDEETGASLVADVSVNGSVAEVAISAAGLPGCKSSPSLTVSGKKPVLRLVGPMACDGDEPEDVTLVLDTAKKTLSFDDAVFTCK